MIIFRKEPVVAAFLVSLVTMTGCDSDGNSGDNRSSDTIASVEEGAVVDEGGESGADASTEPEAGSDTDLSTDNDAVVGTESGAGAETDADIEADADTEAGAGTETGADAATDNDVDTGQPPPPDNVADTSAPEVRYSVRFVATWSAETHPVNFPPDPHFSPLTGAVHNEQVVFWERGQNATDGIEDMAETGDREILLPEIRSAIDQGYAISSVEGGGISVSPGENSVDFVTTSDYPLLTLVSMLAPSPDWFIGINSQSLLDDNGDFVESLTIELNLYDSGTDGGLRYTSPNQDIPRSPIGLVNSFPPDSDFFEGQPSVGTLEITRLP